MDTIVSTQGVVDADLRDRLIEARLEPLWESRYSHKVDGGPANNGHIWRWRDMRPIILSVGEVSSPAVVERRVLSMIEPDARFRDGEATVGAVNATFQMLKPGEQARPHRHSMNALRFVIESTGGAMTVVDGKQCPMERGDLVLTPAWCWHTHVHRGTAPTIWMDVLDVALHRFLGTEAFQPGPITDQPAQLPDSAFTMATMVPIVDFENRDYSPVFRYPWFEAVRSVEAAPEGADGARRVRYANPLTGQESLSLLESTLTHIGAGTTTARLRVGADQVFCVVEGGGQAEIGDAVFAWSAGDVFTVPLGRPFKMTAGPDGPARLFGVSNAPTYDKLGLGYRRLVA